jgi:hypothetical protein
MTNVKVVLRLPIILESFGPGVMDIIVLVIDP